MFMINYVYSYKLASASFQLEGNLLCSALFPFVMNRSVFYLFHNLGEHRHYDHISFNLGRVGSLFSLSVAENVFFNIDGLRI